MSFSKQTWQEQVDIKLTKIKDWWKRYDLPYIVYSTVAGLTIWPLVEAALQTRQWNSVLIALYSVVSGIGGNLVAEQIQKWRDQADKGEQVTEEEVIRWINDQAVNKTEILGTVDKIIVQLNSLEKVEKKLNQGDWQEFSTDLYRELQQLGAINYFSQSTLSLGAHSVAVTGDVNAPIMTGSGSQMTYIAQQIVSQPEQERVDTLPPKLQAYLFNLHSLIHQHFNKEELRDLCFQLGINYEDLTGQGLAAQSREFVLFMDRRNRVPELVYQLQKLRPRIIWPIYYPVDDDETPPFKGLAYFDENDSHLFFGREKFTSKITEHLEKHPFLAIVGASGSGKSSLVRAGVIPVFRQRNELHSKGHIQTNENDWLIQIVTPTENPLEALSLSLTYDLTTVHQMKEIQQEFLGDGSTLYLYGQKLLARQKKSQLLLVVDQFEEVFTCRDESIRKAFLKNLLYVAEQKSTDIIRIIIVLRSDFYSHCAQYSKLREALSQYQLYIGIMDKSELQQAIEMPALQNNWELELGLTEQLLNDVGVLLQENEKAPAHASEPGALPLLSHALLETWRRRSANTLTLQGYLAAGGVRGALVETAESTFQKFTKQQQIIARNIFLHLTELSEDGLHTRRRSTKHVLLTLGDNEEEIQEVIKILASPDARLIILDEESVQVAHEALIRGWPRLKRWIEIHQQSILLHRRLTNASIEWEKHNRVSDYLYQGVRLEEVENWVENDDPKLNNLEHEFIAASIAYREEKAFEEIENIRKEQQLKDQHEANKRLRKFRNLLIGLVLIAIAAAGTAYFYYIQASESERIALDNAEIADNERQIADNERQIAEELSNLLETQALAALANGLTPLSETDKVRTTLFAIEAYRATRNSDGQFDWFIDQRLRASIGNTDSVFFQELQNHESEIKEIAFSSNDIYMATGDADGVVYLWDASENYFEPVMITDESIEIWVLDLFDDTDSEKRMENLEIVSLDFSPDNNFLVVGTKSSIKLFDLSNLSDEPITLFSDPPTEMGELIMFGDRVQFAGFRSDGSLTAVIDNLDDSWQLLEWKQPLVETTYQVLEEYTGSLEAVSYLPEENLIASHYFGDENVNLWNFGIMNPKRISYQEEFGYFQTLGFSSDSKLLAIASSNTIKVFELSSSRLELTATIEHDTDSTIHEIVFSPNNKSIAIVESFVFGRQDTNVYIWDLENLQEEPLILQGLNEWGGAISYSHGGRILAAGSGDGTVRIWSLDNNNNLGNVIFPERNNSFGMAFYDPSNSQLIFSETSPDESVTRILALDSGTSPSHISVLAELPAGFSFFRVLPLGNKIAVWNWTSGFYIIDTQDTETEPLFIESPNSVRSLAFDLRGQTILSTGFGNDILRWDLSENEITPTYYLDGDNTVLPKTIAISSLGWVAVGYNALGRGRTAVHLSQNDTTVELLTGFDIWALEFSPTGRYLAAGTEDAKIFLWDTQNLDKEPTILTKHTGTIWSLAFSPNDKLMASSSTDGEVFIWNIDNLTVEPFKIEHHKGEVLSVSFSPDGRKLASTSFNSIHVWSTLDELVDLGCSLVSRNLTWQEWRLIYSDEPYQKTCPNLPIHESVPAEEIALDHEARYLSTQPQATDFEGIWENVHLNTLSLKRVEIKSLSDELFIQFWGACVPTECDAGNATITFEENPMKIVIDAGFSIRTHVIQLEGNLLRVTTSVEFTDDSGRSDYTTEDFFSKVMQN